MRQTTNLVFSLSILVFGCSDRSPEPGVPMLQWSLADHPALDIGVAEGDEHDELAGASSSLRLADGRIVIANSGTRELRVFDSIGSFLRSIGRKGEGPGEFTGSLQMAGISSSEFAVFDQSAQRLSVFDSAGSLVRESRILDEGGGADFPLWIWLEGNAWVVGPVDTSLRDGVRSALRRLPTPSTGAYRYVQVATDGRIWFQERIPTPASPQPWTVLSPTGGLLGRISLPEGTEIHQVGPDYVLLRHWGENDVEHIRLYRFRQEVPSQPTHDERAPGALALPPDSSARMTMAVAMRNLVMAQEMFYADSAAYARAAGDLSWEGPPGTSLHLMAADKRGWVGVLVHQSQPIICGMAVGGSTPPGWAEGSPKCSR